MASTPGSSAELRQRPPPSLPHGSHRTRGDKEKEKWSRKPSVLALPGRRRMPHLEAEGSGLQGYRADAAASAGAYVAHVLHSLCIASVASGAAQQQNFSCPMASGVLSLWTEHEMTRRPSNSGCPPLIIPHWPSMCGRQHVRTGASRGRPKKKLVVRQRAGSLRWSTRRKTSSRVGLVRGRKPLEMALQNALEDEVEADPLGSNTTPDG